MAIQREVAHRVFAAEFNAARVELKGNQDERAPSYVVTPLGAKINRVLICGVLTECENVSQDGGEMWRARVSDPTGVFTVYAGQYQPEAAAQLSQLSPPQYVAVVGKSRTYEPEPGNIFVSVRPEAITVVDESVRNQWLLDAAKHTLDRVRSFRRAQRDGLRTKADLQRAGLNELAADGLALALERYEGDVDVEFFQRSVQDALQFVLEDGQGLTIKSAPPAGEPRATPKPLVSVAPKAPKPKGPGEEIEKKVLSYIEAMASQDEKGAQWDLIVEQGEKDKLTEDQIEEALNALMDKGLIYEPILGRLKCT
jgi:uncharacterized protein